MSRLDTAMEIVAVDIGGTHARFAVAEVKAGKVVALGKAVTLKTAEHASFKLAWDAFGAELDKPLPRAGGIAVAAPVTGEAIQLTNNPWIIRPALIKEELGLDRHVLINDFAAVALAAGYVGPDYLRHVAGPDAPLPEAGVISIVGPGTGLGVAALLRENGRQHVLPTEGGHKDFAALDTLEDAILARLRQRYGRVSVERIVSGPGLVAIYEAFHGIEDRSAPKIDDTALWALALAGKNRFAVAALDRFCLILGAVAGDVALTQGAGAVVIAGGIGLRLADTLSRSGFAERFVAKGSHRALMETLPVKLITHPQPGLIGAAVAFAQDSILHPCTAPSLDR